MAASLLHHSTVHLHRVLDRNSGKFFRIASVPAPEKPLVRARDLSRQSGAGRPHRTSLSAVLGHEHPELFHVVIRRDHVQGGQPLHHRQHVHQHLHAGDGERGPLPRARLDHEGHVAATETLRQVHLCCSLAVRFGNGSSDGCHAKAERYSRSTSRRMLPGLSQHDLEARTSSSAEPGRLRSAVPGHHVLLHQYHPGSEATERERLLGGQKRQEGYGPGVLRHPALPRLLGSVSLRNFARLTL